MEILFEYIIDVVEVVVGRYTFETIGIGEVFDGERSIRGAADGEVVAVVASFAVWEISGIVSRDGGVFVILTHNVGKFGQAVLGNEL